MFDLRSVVMSAGGFALAGCMTVGPDYTPPDPQSLVVREAVLPDGARSGAPIEDWWTAYDDAELNQLVAETIEANRSLAAARANLRAARATLNLRRLDRLPTDTLTASASLQRQATGGFGGAGPGAGAGVGGGGFAGAGGSDDFNELYSVSYAPAWDLNLFGAVTRRIELAEASYEASLEQARDLQRILIADTATALFTIRNARAERDIILRNINIQTESLRLANALFENGRVTEADVLNARAQLATTEASLPDLDARITEAAARLAVLTGRAAQGFESELVLESPLPAKVDAIPVGSLSALIRSRPDIRAAERQVAVATADTGVNVASLFPDISLVGSASVFGTEPGDLVDDDFLSLSVGPSIRWSPLRLLRADDLIDAAQARTDAAFAQYENAVLVALGEIETSLSAQAAALRQTNALETAREASAEAARIARVRYEFGAADFLAVIDAEERLLEADRALNRNRLAVLNAQIAVFRALGAG